MQFLGSLETVFYSFRSFGKLLTKAQRVRTWSIYAWSTLIAFADIIGLSSMVPVLMLAIDHSFLEKSRKLQAIYHYFGFESEGVFLKALIAFILIFFLVKSLAAIVLNRYVRKTAILLSKDLSSRSYDHSFRHNTYEQVAADGLGFNDTVLFTPFYFVSGIYLPFINLVSESAVVLMLITVFTVYKPLLFFLLAGLLGTAFFIVNRYTRNKITKLGTEGNRHREAALNDLNFGISGFTDVKAHGVEDYFKKRFMDHYSGFVGNGIKAIGYQLIPARINEFVALIGIVVLVVYGYFYSGENLGSVRVMAALFAISVFRLIPAANRLLQSLMHLRLNHYTIEKLGQLADTPEKQEIIIDNFDRDIELEHVGFTYTNSGNTVFEDLGLKINKGEVIGISGPSGCGKTTLAKLLLGFYAPASGSIKVDGRVVPPSGKLFRLFSYMGQEPFILTGTVMENVAMGIPAASVDPAKVLASLEQASFQVKGVSDAVSYFVGENGAKLSEGQKQRLVLARELYRDAPVLILDEPTSSLDASTENEVIHTLDQLKKAGKTMLIIAHRERIFDICDVVYNLENHRLTPKTK